MKKRLTRAKSDAASGKISQSLRFPPSSLKCPEGKPLSKRSDKEIRDRARELLEEYPGVGVPEDALVIRCPEAPDIVHVQAWINLGPGD